MEMLDISRFGILVHTNKTRGIYYVKSIITDEVGKQHAEIYIKHKNNIIVPLDGVTPAGGNFNYFEHGSIGDYVFSRYFDGVICEENQLADFILKLD
jgi:hypothetical protein